MECNTEVLEMFVPAEITNVSHYRGITAPESAPKYSVFFNVSTGTYYYYDGTDWVEIPGASIYNK